MLDKRTGFLYSHQSPGIHHELKVREFGIRNLRLAAGAQGGVPSEAHFSAPPRRKSTGIFEDGG